MDSYHQFQTTSKKASRTPMTIATVILIVRPNVRAKRFRSRVKGLKPTCIPSAKTGMYFLNASPRAPPRTAPTKRVMMRPKRSSCRIIKPTPSFYFVVLTQTYILSSERNRLNLPRRSSGRTMRSRRRRVPVNRTRGRCSVLSRGHSRPGSSREPLPADRSRRASS